ncbi:unnamed protein product [Nezara viridula]|uniref:Transposase n=1 Tax=Nezara viridula TaxID=85310 RepID=A0A9P0HCN7_NEZVI|nr:unnamed protein product [Nezara viridula]
MGGSEISNSEKKRVVKLVDSGRMTVSEAAYLCDRAPSTIYSWRRQMSTSGDSRGNRTTNITYVNINNYHYH